MVTFVNFLSLLRLLLAFLFLPQVTALRIAVLLCAALTDVLDGFLARRWGTASAFGAALDPLMDKLFTFIVLAILWTEGTVNLWETAAMLSRDICLCLFTIYFAFRYGWRRFRFKAAWWGKVTTVLQYVMLMCLVCKLPVPAYAYLPFVGLAIFYFVELLLRHRQTTS